MIEAVKIETPCDYGSQKQNIQKIVSTAKYFPPSTTDPPPALEDQLGVFEQYIDIGDVVASSAEAWRRIADRHSTRHEDALKVGRVAQKALDARKTACSFTQEEMKIIDRVLSTSDPGRISTPVWRSWGAEGMQPNSILGNLFQKWDAKISDVKTVRDNWSARPASTPSKDDESTVASVVTQDTRQFDSAAGQPALSGKTANEMLVDVTFERCDFMSKVVPINLHRSINDDDRIALVNMTLHEYQVSVRQGQESNLAKFHTSTGRGRSGKWPLRTFDVYLLKQPGDRERLAICQPKYGNDDDKEWRLSDGVIPVDPKGVWESVASLTSSARILESLMTNPVPPLMQAAMQRDRLMHAVELSGKDLDLFKDSSLNVSQMRAIATVLSPSFRSGFFCIQGVSMKPCTMPLKKYALTACCFHLS